MILNNFLYSGFNFDQEENHLKFQFRMLNAILLISAFFSALVGVLSDLKINDVGEIHTKINYIYSLVSLALIFLLRREKKNYIVVSHTLLVSSLFTFASALVFVSQDEFRMIWFYLLVFVAFILAGKKSGLLYALVSIGIIITANIFMELHLSEIAIHTAILGLMIASLLSLTYTNRIDAYEKSLKELNENLRELAFTDGLTGIINRRSFDELSRHYFETAKRDKIELSLLILDIDFFKKVNDNYGHHVGDLLLVEFVRTIEPLLRKSDNFGRIGGEEFGVLLSDTDESNSARLAQEICDTIRAKEIQHKGSLISEYVTISIGVVCCIADEALDDEVLISRADEMLYEAKESGRDRYIIASYVSAATVHTTSESLNT